MANGCLSPHLQKCPSFPPSWLLMVKFCSSDMCIRKGILCIWNFPPKIETNQDLFLVCGLNPYSSLRPLGNVYPYSIVVAAKQVKEVNGEIGEFFVQVIFLQIGSRMTILFQFQEVEVSWISKWSKCGQYLQGCATDDVEQQDDDSKLFHPFSEK